MTDRPSPTELAVELAEAEATGGWVRLFSERITGFDAPTARSIARARDRSRRESGDVQIGYKLGWTSAAMRTALGIDTPNWGTLWESQRADGRLDLAGLRHPKIEPELVAEIGEDGAIARWCLGLEVVNPRFESFRFAALDNTADNSSCARVRIGGWVELDGDPAEVEVEFTNGDAVVRGDGSNVDGGPAAAVRWLAESLAREGDALEPGQIVFTGGLTAPFDVVAGATYRLHSMSHEAFAAVQLEAIAS